MGSGWGPFTVQKLPKVLGVKPKLLPEARTALHERTTNNPAAAHLPVCLDAAGTPATWVAPSTSGRATSYLSLSPCKPPPPESTPLCETCCWVPSAIMLVPSSWTACLSRLGSSFNSWEAFPAFSLGTCMIALSLWGPSLHEMKSETLWYLTWSTVTSQCPIYVSVLGAWHMGATNDH